MGRDDIAKEEIAVVRGWSRLYLGEDEDRKGKDHITMGLPVSHLRLGFIKSSIYFTNGTETGKLINYVDPFPCKDPKGKDVIVRFRKIEVSETNKEQDDGNEESSVRSKIEWPE